MLVILYRQPNANIIDTVDRVKALIPALKASIPTDIDMKVAIDRTTTIRASLHDVERTLLVAITLVILVVFLFLRNGRATLVPAAAVPISLLGTFAAMYLLGYSLDNLSLMALIIATGFVVDDAIVVLENITRHMEAGMPRMQAAIQGSKEVGFTVLSMSLSLVAVFIPILAMGGLVGRLFREFSVTLSVAVLVSLLVSLTTTPMMCSRLIRRRDPKQHGRLYQASERVFESVLRSYGRALRWSLANRGLVMVLLLGTVIFNVYLFYKIPKGFFPQQDTGRVIGGIQADQSISFQAMSKKLRQFMQLVKADPDVDTVVGFTGGGSQGGGQTNSGFVFMSLKPKPGRKTSADQVIARLRPKLNQVAGARLFLQAAQDIRSGGRQSNAQYQYTLQADNVADILQLGAEGGRGAAEGARAHRCELRPAAERPADRCEDRPRHRLAPEAQPGHHRRHALRRLRPARRLHHLQPAQPVPRGHGARAAVLAEPGDTEGHLGEHLGGHGHRHPGLPGGGRHRHLRADRRGHQRRRGRQ